MAARNHATVQSIGRAFRLLDAIADRGGQAAIGILANDTGLPLASAHRLLNTLVSAGYLRQLPSRQYALGPGLARLSAVAHQSIGQWAMPCLRRVVEQVGESANLATLEVDEVVYVAH